jgi:hypothetical protein
MPARAGDLERVAKKLGFAKGISEEQFRKLL